MRSLLLAGLGPEIKNDIYLAGSLLDTTAQSSELWRRLDQVARLRDLRVGVGQGRKPLLRRAADAIPDLTSVAIASILETAGEDYEVSDIARTWADAPPDVSEPFDVVLLSTTFIWNQSLLRQAVRWVETYFPSAVLVCGGQYSNLKYRQILSWFPSIKFIVRGDAEEALPQLLRAVGRKESVSTVPNLVYRREDTGSVVENRMMNIDLESTPSPVPRTATPIMPYESMRGCPFRCKFCSFPFASPEWRYKSAEKMARDWRHYADEFGTTMVKAHDSTFTVPPTRMESFFDVMPIPNLQWQAYSRANVIRTPEYVERLVESGCDSLSLGFESMSESSLENMNKKVRVADNRRAFELLRGSPIGYKISFMAGYPGETPEDYQMTEDFLVNEYQGHFLLNVFSLTDETMPVWDDAERFGLTLVDDDPDNPAWVHRGMSSELAWELVWNTLDRVRRQNDGAVLNLWQQRFNTPLVAGAGRTVNFKVEKAVERMALVTRDYATEDRCIAEIRKQRDVLAGLGVGLDEATHAATS